MQGLLICQRHRGQELGLMADPSHAVYLSLPTYGVAVLMYRNGEAASLRCGAGTPTAPGPVGGIKVLGRTLWKDGDLEDSWGYAQGRRSGDSKAGQGRPPQSTQANLCLVKMGKLRPREWQGLKTPDSFSPACNLGVPGQSPVLQILHRGRRQLARSDRGGAEVRTPKATAGDGSPPGLGGAVLAASLLSVCLCAGSGLQGTLCRLSFSPPSLVPSPPCRPPVRMSDGCAPPQAPGPRPGSRSLAADTVCFPARDAHPPSQAISPGAPHPHGPAWGSRVLGRTCIWLPE